MKAITKCDCCGKTFKDGYRPDGIPNGLGFQLQDGRIFNMCAECLVDTEKRDAFIEKFKGVAQ